MERSPKGLGEGGQGGERKARRHVLNVAAKRALAQIVGVKVHLILEVVVVKDGHCVQLSMGWGQRGEGRKGKGGRGERGHVCVSDRAAGDMRHTTCSPPFLNTPARTRQSPHIFEGLGIVLVGKVSPRPLGRKPAALHIPQVQERVVVLLWKEKEKKRTIRGWQKRLEEKKKK